jgi:thiol:disulfide interchange protein DsbD
MPSATHTIPSRIALVLAFLMTGALPAWGAGDSRGEGAYDDGEARVAAELVVDAAGVRPGDSVRVGVLFTMDPGWHIYWRHSGDSGKPTELYWQSLDAEVGPTDWPAPRAYREADILTTYGYDGDVLLASDAVVGATARDTWRIEVETRFVVCQVQCIPGKIRLAREVAVVEGELPPPSSVHHRFALANARVPQSPETLGVRIEARTSQTPVRPGDTFRAALDVSSCEGEDAACLPWTLAADRLEAVFVPDPAKGSAFAPLGLGPAPASNGSVFSVVLSGRLKDDAADGIARLRGVLPLLREGRVAHLAVDLPLPQASAGAEVAAADDDAFAIIEAFASSTADDGHASESANPIGGGLALGRALLLALLGGLVLNLMPCVLPVLALKVFAVAELAHEGRGRVAQHGLAYLGGVLASMLALAAVVVALRAAGTSVGWGFQFQEPVFVAAIGTLLLVFAMNLFGVFEVTLQAAGPEVAPHEASPARRRSFFEGTLAVAVATPCTAPFLGTAVGFAFASSTAAIFTIFAAIGVGLALPFVLVTLVPGWARFIPRPGAWMLRVRAGLGFALLATVVWLLWVMGRAVGVDAQALLLGALVVIAFLLWIFGSLQATGRTGAARAIAVGTAVFIAAALFGLPLDPTPAKASRPAAEATGIEAWNVYDPAAIARERAAGRPVFVDFGADWCITCQLNESAVLARDVVQAELAAWNFATFKADWTLHDEEIGRALAARGRAGVPMYLVYPADPNAEAELLPELLTVDETIRALRAAGLGRSS